MPADRPMKGLGHFHWNTGAWFGGLIGCTSWLLVGACVLAARAPWVAIVWLCCFALLAAAGIGLWRYRSRLRPYAAIQMLLFLCGVGGLLAWLALDLLRPDVVPRMSWPRHGYRMLLIVPALMAWFAVLEYAARGRSRPQADTD